MLTDLIWGSFNNMYLYPVITLYTLNLCVLYVNNISVRLKQIPFRGAKDFSVKNKTMKVHFHMHSVGQLVRLCSLELLLDAARGTVTILRQ